MSPCDCRWSEAMEKRVAAVEDALAPLLRGARLRMIDGQAVLHPALRMSVQPRDVDTHVLAASAQAFRATRRAEVEGYAIDAALYLLDELAARRCRIVRTK